MSGDFSFTLWRRWRFFPGAWPLGSGFWQREGWEPGRWSGFWLFLRCFLFFRCWGWALQRTQCLPAFSLWSLCVYATWCGTRLSTEGESWFGLRRVLCPCACCATMRSTVWRWWSAVLWLCGVWGLCGKWETGRKNGTCFSEDPSGLLGCVSF